MTVDVPSAAAAYVHRRDAPGGGSTTHAVIIARGCLVLCVAALLIVSPSAMSQANTEFETRVLRVVSGDTVIVERDGGEVELRIADIGAPQGSQFLAPSSRTAVDGMVRNRAVRVQVTGVEEGVRIYGRLFAGRLDVARAQVQRGNAWVCWDYALDSELMPVENEAKRHRRGVWRTMMDVTSRSECRRRPPVPPSAEPKAPAKPN
jgi:endonuclease YncB( thermonuclease family)